MRVDIYYAKFISKGRLQMRDNNKDYLCPKCKIGQDNIQLVILVFVSKYVLKHIF